MDWIFENYRVITVWIVFGSGVLLLVIPKWLGMDDEQEMKKGARAIRTVGVLIILLIGYGLLMRHLKGIPLT